MNRKSIITAVVCNIIVMFALSGCSSENKEALPHADPAKVQQARQDNIQRVKDNPNMTPEQKARALQYMGGGANGAAPLGSTQAGAAPAAPK